MTMIEIEIKAIMQNSSNPLQFEVFLSEVKGIREFAFVVNQAKGRALIMALDTKKPNHGLHHLYIDTLHKTNMQLQKINITNYEQAEFETQLILKKEDLSLLSIECTIYDALIFSVLSFCPIFIEENLLDIVIDEQKNIFKFKPMVDAPPLKEPSDYKKVQTPYLEKMLSLAIKNEEYEKAISIRDELQKRKAQ